MPANQTSELPHRPAAVRGEPMVLDLKAIEQARHDAEQGQLMPQHAAWRTDIVKLLNGALATELVCALRYRRHHFTATGMASARIAEEFLVHANEELGHADRLARRIVQLGGEPDLSPDTLTSRSHAAYDGSLQLKAMIRANLVAERVAMETYGQMIVLVGQRDPATRRLLEEILTDEQAHAEELTTWLSD
jgi:bacterioferritin